MEGEFQSVSTNVRIRIKVEQFMAKKHYVEEIQCRVEKRKFGIVCLNTNL